MDMVIVLWIGQRGIEKIYVDGLFEELGNREWSPGCRLSMRSGFTPRSQQQRPLRPRQDERKMGLMMMVVVMMVAARMMRKIEAS